MKIALPSDVEKLIVDAEQFSKQIRKQTNAQVNLEKRLTIEKLEKLESDAKTYCLVTPEISRLQGQLQNSYEWLVKVAEAEDVESTLKDLEKLLKCGKSLPVNFGEPFFKLSLRLKQAQDL